MKTNTFVIGIFLAMRRRASAPPANTGRPQDQTAAAGTTATLTVEAAGKDQLRVWRRGRDRRLTQAQDSKN